MGIFGHVTSRPQARQAFLFSTISKMIETDESHPLPHASLTSSSPEPANKINRILVLAHDGSENADYAFYWILEHLFREGDHLVVVKVFPTADAIDLYSFGQDLSDQLKQIAEGEVWKWRDLTFER